MVDIKRKQPKEQMGVVISNKMDKTAVVEVVRRVGHPRYKKYIDRWARYKAHDKDNQVKPGDQVLIRETRPLSRDKRWKIVKILERVKG